MKKELNYLSLPDHFNKFLLVNFNQKPNNTDVINLQFKLSSNYHLGSALKAIYLLEIYFPRKSFVLKINLKQKKLYFGQKSKTTLFFKFNLNFRKSYLDNSFIINRKLKQFEFNKNISFFPQKVTSSFFFLKSYHLD